MNIGTHEHRWNRYRDADGKINHWCVDGDTEHHDEPCADQASRTGDHETDPPGVEPDEWPMPFDDFKPDQG